MILQLIISIGLINVWFFRFNKATEYRGGGAKNMKEEFIAYGLPIWSMYFVGFVAVFFLFLINLQIGWSQNRVSLASPCKTMQNHLEISSKTQF